MTPTTATPSDIHASDVRLRPHLPTELQLEVTGACNLRCRMCLVRYRPPLGRKQGAMSFEMFRDLLDALPDLEVLTLQGLGEPLLAPDLPRMIDEAVARGLQVGFNTNATLLDRAWAERLVDTGASWLHVSIDGATDETYGWIRDRGNLEAVTTNLRTLIAVRRDRGRDRPRIQLNVVAMRRNLAELPALVRLGAELGVDRVWVQNLSHDFTDDVADGDPAFADIRRFVEDQKVWDTRSDEVATFFAEARRLADRLGVDLRLPAAVPSVEADHDESHDQPNDRRAGEPGCDWPWRSAYVNHDGRVQPCCMVMGADRAVVGDLRESTFDEIWYGDPLTRFRAALLSHEPPDVCRGCAFYRGTF